MKARFSEKQDQVKFTTIGTKTTVQICLNEETETVTPVTGDPYKDYVYDFHEFTEENPDTDAIKKNPENYLDYEPTVLSQDDRIKILEDTIEKLLIANLEG